MEDVQDDRSEGEERYSEAEEKHGGAEEISSERGTRVLEDDDTVQLSRDIDQHEPHANGSSTCQLEVNRILVRIALKVPQNDGTLHCPWVSAIGELCPAVVQPWCIKGVLAWHASFCLDVYGPFSHRLVVPDCAHLPFLSPPHDADMPLVE